MSTEMQTSGKVTLAVTGMSCGGCAGSVQRALERHPGVASAAVSLARNNATVEFDPAATSPGALVEAVRATGYDAELADPAAGSAD
ncbi:MAG TPA: heavy metal-associated domain-containing protein [Longimicrobium sp.]|nr:heavy metal-associated domain-containing protein [Longimicrobium sp.]